MNLMVRTAAAMGVAWAVMAGGAGAATPPTDKEVFGAIQAYGANMKKLTEDAKRENKPVSGADRVRVIDEVLKDISVGECSLNHLQQLLHLAGLSSSSKAGQARARLLQLAQDQGAAGAEAMLTLLPFRLGEKDPVKRAEYVTSALGHPGLKDLLAASKGFRDLLAIAPNDKVINPMIAPSMLSLTVVMPDECGPASASMLGRLYDNVLEITGEELKEQREPMRLKFLAMVKLARAKILTDDDRAKALKLRLGEAEASLASPLAKGTLVGGPAPEIRFAWSSFEPAVSKLSDLRGKVVVVEYWATWARPCVDAMPTLKELAAKYKDAPVAIVSITSIQGKHWPDPSKDPIDCKDNPKKETDLMKEYMKEKGMTWAVAFADSNSFAMTYGVRDIPHVVIIDPSGVVRHRGLTLDSKVTPTSELIKKIDGLLNAPKASAPSPAPTATPAPAAGGH